MTRDTLDQLRGGFPVTIDDILEHSNPIDEKKGFHAIVVLDTGTGFTKCEYKTNAGTVDAAADGHFSNMFGQTYDPPYVITFGGRPITNIQLASGRVAALIFGDIE